MQNNTKNKGFHSLFHGKQTIGDMQNICFWFVCLFWTRPNQGLFLAVPFLPRLPRPSRLPCASLLFPFIYWIFEKNRRGSPTSHRLGELVSLQGCRCWAERAGIGSREARRVLSIIQHVKREEGARKRGREKAGSRMGGKKSLDWIGGISSPWLLKGGFLDICPDTCRVKEAG